MYIQQFNYLLNKLEPKVNKELVDLTIIKHKKLSNMEIESKVFGKIRKHLPNAKFKHISNVKSKMLNVSILDITLAIKNMDKKYNKIDHDTLQDVIVGKYYKTLEKVYLHRSAIIEKNSLIYIKSEKEIYFLKGKMRSCVGFKGDKGWNVGKLSSELRNVVYEANMCDNYILRRYQQVHRSYSDLKEKIESREVTI